MAVTKEQKQSVLAKFRKNDLDTGSCEVQIALLSARILSLTDHFTTHKKDEHGKRGLVKAVNKRRKLLDYLAKQDRSRYEKIVADLELRR